MSNPLISDIVNALIDLHSLPLLNRNGEWQQAYQPFKPTTTQLIFYLFMMLDKCSLSGYYQLQIRKVQVHGKVLGGRDSLFTSFQLVRRGGGKKPPSFFQSYVIVTVFFVNERIQPRANRVIPGKGGLTFCRLPRFNRILQRYILYSITSSRIGNWCTATNWPRTSEQAANLLFDGQQQAGL